MEKVILERCCGNCEWSISPECEREIMIENHYDEDDSTRPRAGDCVWGYNHDGKFVCNNHKFLEAGLDTYVLYDNRYIAPGYFIITKYYDEIIRFLKIYRCGSYGNYNYNIIGYEVDPLLINNGKLKEIEFKVAYSDNKELFDAINNLAQSLNGGILYSINSKESTNAFSAESYKYTAYLILTKDASSENNFINIKLGDSLACDKFAETELFFRDLARISTGTVEEVSIKKILKIEK